jgi:hypothetical protein
VKRLAILILRPSFNSNHDKNIKSFKFQKKKQGKRRNIGFNFIQKAYLTGLMLIIFVCISCYAGSNELITD